MDLGDILQAVSNHWPGERTPTNLKLLVESLNGKRSPITEQDFSPEELTTLRDLIEHAYRFNGNNKGPSNRGSVQYSDYTDFAHAQKVKGAMGLPWSIGPSLLSTLDDYGRLQTSLGRFSYQMNPDNSIDVMDEYDFNRGPLTGKGDPTLNVEMMGATGPYGAIRTYAGEKLPPGEKTTRPVKIKLKK